METLTALLLTTSVQFGLPSGLLDSVCWVESGHNPTAIHKHDGDSDSIGLCQIKYKTAKWLGFKGREKDLYNPKINAYYAAKYLQYQIKRYNGNTKKAIIAYNIGNAKQLTNTAYSDKVIKHWGNTNHEHRRQIASTK